MSSCNSDHQNQFNVNRTLVNRSDHARFRSRFGMCSRRVVTSSENLGAAGKFALGLRRNKAGTKDVKSCDVQDRPYTLCEP